MSLPENAAAKCSPGTVDNCLDLFPEQSDEWSCQRAKTPLAGGESTQLDMVRLMSAKEAGQILGINPNAVYALWRNRLLDYWNINGTKKTNLHAITMFLDATRNQVLALDNGKE